MERVPLILSKGLEDGCLDKAKGVGYIILEV
jgi:hypothetical protein